MKVLQVVASIDPKLGGVSRNVRDVSDLFIKLGYECEVLCSDHPSEVFEFKDKFITHATGLTWKYYGFSFRFLKWLYRNIDKYDYVLVHGLWQAPSALTFLVFKLKSIFTKKRLPKVILRTHGMLDPWFQKAPSRKLKAFRNLIYWHLIEKKVVNFFDALLFTCEEERRLARVTFSGYFPKKEIVLGYGVTTPPEEIEAFRLAFYKVCPELKNKRFLLFLSRIDPKKGIDILIKAYSNICRKYDDLSCLPYIAIAGPGVDTQYGIEMKKLAKKVCPSDSVFWIPFVDSQEKWGALYCSEAFILPSHQENFGIAVVEALACGKAVLITNKINIWKEIYDDSAGIAAEDTVEEISLIIEKWISLTSKEKQKMGQKAIELFRSRYQMEVIENEFIKELNKI